MRKIILLAVCLGVLISCSNPPATPSIIPKPVFLRVTDGALKLSSPFKITGPSTEEGGRLAGLLEESLRSRNYEADPGGAVPVNLTMVSYDSAVKEGFHQIVVNDFGVQISSNTGAGLFYGIQTFLQLLPEKGTSDRIAPVNIIDYPRFPYRGLHLDVSRHFFPASFIKQYIDWLAFHKFNYFHWHLTDDQGWRIEIKKYPELQKIASTRKETLIGHAGIPENFDGTPYGGFYTQEEIREVVAYAAARYVTVVPEIEMPGHALAALTAYPSLGCTGGPYQVGTKWGVFQDVFCAGKEETFEFLSNVLDEVVSLFPGPYVHVGGDECPKDRWKECPRCQKRMKTEGLKDEHELQSYFIQRVEKFLNSRDRRLIGWNEILEGGLAPNATVMSWQGEQGGITAAKQQHDVIMTPGGWCYFDHYQDTTKGEPLAFGGFTPVSKVYSYEPVPSALSTEEAKHVLGSQANLWTEYVTSPEHAAYMAYPRACALAEVVWSPKAARDYQDFLNRLQVHLPRLDKMGINYAKHISKEFTTKPTNP